jgi:hypothetical protein
MTRKKKSPKAKKAGKPVKVKAEPDKPEPLTPKEEAFALYYTGESKFNATDALRRAGTKGADGTIRTLAHRMLTKDNVKAHIIELTEQRFKDAGYSIDRTVREIMDCAFYDAKDFFTVDDEGYVRLKEDWDELPSAAIKAVSSTAKRYIKSEECETWITRIEFQDKKWALEMLSKLLEMKSGETGDKYLIINEVNVNMGDSSKSGKLFEVTE